MGRNLGAGAVAAMLPALMAVAVLQVSPARAAAAIAGSTCTSVGISTDFPSPQKVGATVTVTPDATGCPNGPLFRWWVRSTDGVWRVAQDWSTQRFAWNTSGLTPGTYQLGVWLKDSQSANTYDTFALTTYLLA